MPVVVHLGVEALGHDVHYAAVARQLFGDGARGLLHKRQRRGLKWFDEAGRQAHGHAVALPKRLAVPGLEADGAVGDGLRVDVRGGLGDVAF